MTVAGFGKYDSGSVGCVPTICSVNFFKGDGSISYTTYVEKKAKRKLVVAIPCTHISISVLEGLAYHQYPIHVRFL